MVGIWVTTRELLEHSGSELGVEMMGEREQDSSLLDLAVRPGLYTALYLFVHVVQLAICVYIALIIDKRGKGHWPIRYDAIMVSYGARMAP